MIIYINKKRVEIPLNNRPKLDKDPETGRFLPGHSPLSPGRPKGSISLTERIKRKLQELGPDKKEEIIDKLAGNIVQSALNGSALERRLIWNYLEGMPKAQLDLGMDKEGLSELTEFFRNVAKK